MADQEDFQMIVSSQDYKKMALLAKDVEPIQLENQQLKKVLAKAQNQIKDLKKSVYIRDSFIQLLGGQFLQTFGTILGYQIIDDDSITKSFYQQVVTHEQNGISSIQLRKAMDLYTDQNSKIFQQIESVSDEFDKQNRRVIELQKRIKSLQEANENLKTSKVSQINQSQKRQQAQQLSAIKKGKQELEQLQFKIKIAQDQNQRLTLKNDKMRKQMEGMRKKRETTGEKSYVLKLMVDEYYTELEQNLLKMGGLDEGDINLVIGNEMKGIIHYIEALTKKKM